MNTQRIILAICCSVAFDLLGSSMLAAPIVEIIAKTARVKVEQETIAVVEKGQQYRLLKSSGAWVAIQLGERDDAKRGWVLASAVRLLDDPQVTEETAAPAVPVDVRVSIDLTQFSPNYGQQSAMYFKIEITNETAEPISLKVEEIALRCDGKPLPKMQTQNFHGYPVFTDASMRAQIQANALSYLKDATLAPGAVTNGWLGFSLADMQQGLFNPSFLAEKTWVIEGMVGPYPIQIDLKANETQIVPEKLRASKLDPSVQVIDIGSRINALNAGKILELLRTIPASDQGCVLVLTNKECLFDGLANQQFQQQMFQLFQQNYPVVSFEGQDLANPMYGYQSVFHYGQFQKVESESAGTLTILGRRPQTGATLINHLKHEKRDVRAAAASALTQHLAEPNVVKSLVMLSVDPEPIVRIAVIGALGGNGQIPPEMRQNGSIDTAAIIKGMMDVEIGVRNAAAQAAALFACDEVRAPLTRLLDDPDFSVKLSATVSVGTLQIAEAVPKLKELQADANQQLKTSAIEALMKIGELTPFEGALAKLDGGYLQDADYAALGRARDKRAVEPLITRLKSQDVHQVNLAARTLGDLHDPKAVEPLIHAYVFGNRQYGMEEVPRALGKLGDRRAIEPLAASLGIPNQYLQPQMRGAIYEGLLQLKAPNVFDEVIQEIKKMEANNRHFEIGPMLLALGRSRDAKAIAVIEPFLANQQTSTLACQAMFQLGTKSAFAALESRLNDANFPNAQMVILNQTWPRTAATVALLKRISDGQNPNARMAATQALNNLQANAVHHVQGIGSTGQAAIVPAPIGYFAPSIVEENAVEHWINGKAPTNSDVRGKVVAIYLPETSGASPDLPVAGNQILSRFESQGVTVVALWKYAGWNWDAAMKKLTVWPDTSAEQEQQSISEFARARGMKYPVGLISATSGLTEKFGGTTGARVAIVDRAGILQAVRTIDEVDVGSTDLESLVAQLLAESPPSASAIRMTRQIPPPPDVPKLPRTAILAYSSSSFDPAAKSITIPAHHGTIWSVKFAPNNKTIATTSEDGTARIWNLETGKLIHTLNGHTGIIRSCAFDGDGAQLITCGYDQTIRIWDTHTGAATKILTDDSTVYSLSPLDGGQTLISGSQDLRLRQWDLSEGQIKRYFTGHTGSAFSTAAAATPGGGATIVSGSLDRTVRIWDFPSGAARQTLEGHQSGINAVATTIDAKTVASAADEIILWDAVSGTEKLRIPKTGYPAYDLTFSLDQKMLAVGRGNHSVTLYDSENGKVLRHWQLGGWCVDFSKDGKLLATGSDDRTIRIWQITETH